MCDLRGKGFTGYIVSSDNFYEIITAEVTDLISLTNHLSVQYGIDLHDVNVVRCRVEFLEDEE